MAISTTPLRRISVLAFTLACSVGPSFGAEPTLVRVMATGDRRDGTLGDGYLGYVATPQVMATNVAKIATGNDYSAFLKTDGTLWTTGNGVNGQLADGTRRRSFVPGQAAAGVSSVHGGLFQTFFVKTDGSLWGAGSNSFGQLGQGTSGNDHPTPVPIATDVVHAEGGNCHAAFLKVDGTLWTMGSNASGQLGDGSTTSRFSPVQIATSVTAFSANGDHTLFIKSDQTLWACGSNTWGQLGDGTDANRSTPIQVATNVSSVSAGGASSFFIKTDGGLWAMGYNGTGQLGNGTSNTGAVNAAPFQIATNAVAVVGSAYHTLFLKADGTCWATGENAFGQLGDGTTTEQVVPVQVMGGVAAIAAKGRHSLFLKTDGTLLASGRSEDGELGDGVLSYRTAAAQVLVDAAKVVSRGGHTLFEKTDGATLAVGNNLSGQLGNGTSGTYARSSTPVNLTPAVLSLTVGGSHTAFVKPDGTLWTVGYNNNGELGDGANAPRSTPIQITSAVRTVGAGLSHTLFVKNDDSLWGMGWNSGGQLADGTTTNRNSPYQIATNVAAGTGGNAHTLFLKNDGTLWAVGYNNAGQLGDGTNIPRTAPVMVATGVSAISAGTFHSLFITTSGELWGMGSNAQGELGTGPSGNRYTPVKLATDVTAAAAGHDHTAFIKTDGSLWTMGTNELGQLGDGTTIARFIPTKIATGVSYVAAGRSRTFFIQTVTRPQIVTQPLSQLVLYDTAGTLQVSAQSHAIASYQWYRGNTGDVSQPIAGAHATSYITGALTAAASFWVRATNIVGSADSATATVQPVRVPTIATQPVNRQIAVNGTAQLSVIATSEVPPTFQWYRGNTGDTSRPETGGTSTDFTTPAIAIDTAFWVRVSNAVGYADSAAATVDTVARPAIQNQPQPQTIVSGQTAVLSVTAASEVSPGYQWYRGLSGETTHPISGATTYQYTPPALTNHTSFWVRVSNLAGTTDSEAALISVTGPIISLPPASQTPTRGSAVTFSITAASSDGSSVTYQWFLNGIAIIGATSSSLTIPSVQTFHAGTYMVEVRAMGHSVSSTAAILTASEPPGSESRLVNLSTRGLAQSGDNVLIPGFVIAGTGSKRLLLRAVGPTLAQIPFNLAGTLADPRLTLKRFNPALPPSGGYEDIFTNDNWATNANAAAITQTAANLLAFPFADAREAALLVDLAPGQYTVIADDKNGASGIGIVELYDADPSTGSGQAPASRLINISNRGFAGVGDQVMIPGFVVSPEGPRTLLVRVVGPTLGAFGVPNTMADPKLAVFPGGASTPILANDNWSDNSDAAYTAQIASQVSAFPLTTGSKDAAFVVTLPPGSYTVVGSSAVAGGTGVVLVEVYVVP